MVHKQEIKKKDHTTGSRNKQKKQKINIDGLSTKIPTVTCCHEVKVEVHFDPEGEDLQKLLLAYLIRQG